MASYDVVLFIGLTLLSGDGSTDRAAVARAAAAALAATVRAAACDLAAVQVIHPMLARTRNCCPPRHMILPATS